MELKTQRLLTRARKIANKGEIEEAEKLYSQIWSKITDEKLTWSESLHTALTEVNRKLLDILVRFSTVNFIKNHHGKKFTQLFHFLIIIKCKKDLMMFKL